MKKLFISTALIGLLAASHVFAADKPSKANDVDFFATVNGTPLTKAC
jgi:hypothetical protein